MCRFDAFVNRQASLSGLVVAFYDVKSIKMGSPGSIVIRSSRKKEKLESPCE